MHTTQLSIVCLSASAWDLLAVGPIEKIRWRALRRGANRLRQVRAARRWVQSKIDFLGAVVWQIFATILAAGCYVGSTARAGYNAVASRVSRAVNRVVQCGRVAVMYARLFAVIFTGRRRPSVVSRKCQASAPVPIEAPAPAGWTEIDTSTDVEPVPVATGHAHAVPMVSAARLTHEDEVDDRAKLVKKAKAMLAKGESKRATAKALGVADATLRGWLKKAK